MPRPSRGKYETLQTTNVPTEICLDHNLSSSSASGLIKPEMDAKMQNMKAVTRIAYHIAKNCLHDVRCNILLEQLAKSS